MSNATVPVVVEFAPGSRLLRQEHVSGLPNAVVLMPTGEQVAIPADQLVFDEDIAGAAHVGLGGMSFEGMKDDEFVFWRVRDLVPEEYQTSDDRLTLAPGLVTRILVQGTQVYPKAQ